MRTWIVLWATLLFAPGAFSQKPFKIRPASEQDQELWSLYRAALRNQAGVVKMFLQLHVDVDQPGPDGSTPLDAACLKGHVASAEILLDHNASVTARNRDGMMPLHDAAVNGNTQLIGLLLSHHAPIDATDTVNGSTPLIYASAFGHLPAVKLLVEKGSSLDTRNKKGQTALQSASDAGFDEVVTFLKSQVQSSGPR